MSKKSQLRQQKDGCRSPVLRLRELEGKELQLTLYQGTAAIMKMPTIQTNKEV